jgi:hypothetical protein
MDQPQGGDDYPKTGILVDGSVAAMIIGNEVGGALPVDDIAQNSLQIGLGATAIIWENEVSGNDYTSRGTVECGLLMLEADGVRAPRIPSRTARNVCAFGQSGRQFQPES